MATPDRVTEEAAFEMSRVWSGRMAIPGALSARKVTVESWTVVVFGAWRGGAGRGGAGRGRHPAAGLLIPAAR